MSKMDRRQAFCVLLKNKSTQCIPAVVGAHGLSTGGLGCTGADEEDCSGLACETCSGYLDC